MAIKFKMFREKLEEEVAKVLVVENDAPGTDMTTGNTQGLGGGGGAVQIPGHNRQDLGDGTIAPFMIEDESVRKAVNSFITSHLSERAYLNPREALVHLRTKLNIVGLTFNMEPGAIMTTVPEDGVAVEEGTVEEYDLLGYGGTMGMDLNGQFVKDDGLSGRTGSPMVLRVTYTEGINRLHSLDAEIVPKDEVSEEE